MAEQPEVGLTGRAPTSPGDFYVVDSAYPSGRFERAIVGTVAGYAAALEGVVSVAVAGSLGWVIALRGVVSAAEGATMGGVCPLSLESYLTGSPTSVGHIAMIRFNCDVSGSTPDYLFIASNPASVAYEAGLGAETSSKYGGIKIRVIGSNIPGGDGWLRVYQGND